MRRVGSGPMGQEQNSTGEGENLWCGVRTIGVRSGPMGWSQDPWDKDRPCTGLDMVALWDTAACPSHAGAVWVPCGCRVGAVWVPCGCCAPCLAVTHSICRRKRCLSQPAACTECRSGTGILQHPAALMGPAQGDTAVPMVGTWLGVSSIDGLEWVKGNASRARTWGGTACPHNTPKGTARGTDRAVSSRPSPKGPPGLMAGLGLSHKVTMTFRSPTDGGTGHGAVGDPTTAGSPRCRGVGTDVSQCGQRGGTADCALNGHILGGEKPKAVSWGDSLSPRTAAPHHPDHPRAHGGAARGRRRLGQQGEIQQEARAGGERGDGAGMRVTPRGHPSPQPPLTQLRTREGSEFLIQHDSEQIVATWHRAIADSIALMSSDVPTEEDAESGTEFGSREKLGGEERRAGGSTAPQCPQGDAHPALPPQPPPQLTATPAKCATSSASSSSGGRRCSPCVSGDTSKVGMCRGCPQVSPPARAHLPLLPPDQVFGCSLQALCEREHGTVPRFVLQCIHTVERRGLDIDGLYRVSGNLATIQKLRYKVDHEEHLDLDDGRWEDVHVITGALKLFFRELPEPLVPFGHFDKFIAAIKMQDPVRKGRCVRDLVRSLPPANHDTMKVLFEHLCRVIEFKEENRMSVQSIAIVFGPTLLRAPSEEGSMAVHMVFQNQVVELILNQYGHIFPDG
uniref:Rho GTPase activating protein 27 n=1 Tax=Pavo cristatus TaxID=9049 RepID=A0A8C9L690_PAVCR